MSRRGLTARRARLVDDRRVETIEQEDALAEVRGEQHQPVGHRQLGGAQRDAIAGRRALEAALGGQHSPARDRTRTASRRPSSRAARPWGSGAGAIRDRPRDVEQEPLVERVGVVVQVARDGAREGVAGGGELRRQVVAREVAARVHGEHGRYRARAAAGGRGGPRGESRRSPRGRRSRGARPDRGRQELMRQLMGSGWLRGASCGLAVCHMRAKKKSRRFHLRY